MITFGEIIFEAFASFRGLLFNLFNISPHILKSLTSQIIKDSL